MRHAWRLTPKLLLFCTAVAARPQSHAAPITVTADLRHTGKTQRIILDPARDPALAVWQGRRKLWEGVPRRWQPWKLMTADVDGDGHLDIILGVHKGTRFFPQPHNCLFVYGWDGRQGYAKWLGSSLGKPFTNFAFIRRAGKPGDQLVGLETRRDGKKCVVAYSWIGFGFAVDWERGAWQHATLVTTTPGRPLVQADGQTIDLTQISRANSSEVNSHAK